MITKTDKVYISGPMTSIKDFNAEAFKATHEELDKIGCEVVDPWEINIGCHSQPYAGLMRRDLKALLDCTVIVLLPGWMESKGAKIETMVAKVCGMRVYSYFHHTSSQYCFQPVNNAHGFYISL